MSMFNSVDPRVIPTRELRRLAHSPAVATTYANRAADEESVEGRRAAVHRQGYEDGYAQGLERALADADRVRSEESLRIETALAALTQAITDVREAGVGIRSEIQASAPRLAFALVEQLLGRELELSLNPGREAIIRILSLDAGTNPATIRMNPADVLVLGEISDLGLTREVKVVADPVIESGGVLVELGDTTLDGQLNTALERVRKALLGSVKSEVLYDRAV
jgi:flagellar assembly protein FliH